MELGLLLLGSVKLLSPPQTSEYTDWASSITELNSSNLTNSGLEVHSCRFWPPWSILCLCLSPPMQRERMDHQTSPPPPIAPVRPLLLLLAAQSGLMGDFWDAQECLHWAIANRMWTGSYCCLSSGVGLANFRGGSLCFAFCASAFGFEPPWMLRHAAQRLPVGMRVIACSSQQAARAATRWSSSCFQWQEPRADERAPPFSSTTIARLQYAVKRVCPMIPAWFFIAPCSSVGLSWTMKLWDSLTTCLILLSAVHASRLFRSRPQPTSTESNGRAPEIPLELPPVQIRLSVTSPGIGRAEAGAADWEETLAGGEQRKSPCLCMECPKCPNKHAFNLHTAAGFHLFLEQIVI